MGDIHSCSNDCSRPLCVKGRADRAAMADAGLVPISFDPPPADAGCPGKWSAVNRSHLGLCHLCSRFGDDTPQMEPAARLVQGVAVCLNWRAVQLARPGVGGVHASQSAPNFDAVQSQGCGGVVAASTPMGVAS